MGGLINIHFYGGIALCKGDKFFQGGLRGVLPNMYILGILVFNGLNTETVARKCSVKKLMKIFRNSPVSESIF